MEIKNLFIAIFFSIFELIHQNEFSQFFWLFQQKQTPCYSSQPLWHTVQCEFCVSDGKCKQYCSLGEPINSLCRVQDFSVTVLLFFWSLMIYIATCHIDKALSWQKLNGLWFRRCCCCGPYFKSYNNSKTTLLRCLLWMPSIISTMYIHTCLHAYISYSWNRKAAGCCC